MRKTILFRTTTIVSLSLISIVLTLSLFRTFEVQTVEAAADTPEARGELIFKSLCSGCHHAHLTESRIGPGLKGLFNWENFPVSQREVSENNVVLQIKEPHKNMPRVADNLTEEQLNDLIDYLKTL